MDRGRKLEFLNLISKEKDYELIEELDNSKFKIKHLICGTIYEINYFKFLNGRRCPNKLCKQSRTKETNLKKYGTEFIFNSSIVKEKIKETNKSKYGHENPMKNNNVVNKLKNTNLNRYGTTCTLYNEEINKKVKKTIKDKYNVEYISQSEEIKKKIYETNNKKYGSKYYLQTEDYKNKTKQTCLKKYGIINSSSSKEIKNRIKKTRFTNYYKKLINLSSVKPLFTLKDYNGVHVDEKYLWQCLKCGKTFYDGISWRLPRCLNCYPIKKGYSNIEQEIFSWLSKYIKCEKKIFENKYELDIYIKDKDFGIELDGIYWHSELGGHKDKYYHLNKTLFFLEKNIKVMHIYDIEWINKQEIVKFMILSKLGLIKNRIYARKCNIKEITSEESSDFYENNHLQGSVYSLINLALFYENNLVSCLSFSKPRFNKKYQYEITRFASLNNFNIIGGFSKLLKYFIRKYNPKSLITYADRRYSFGKLYLENGFIYNNISQPNYFYTKDYKELESRLKYQKHKLKNILSEYNERLTEWENMQLNGYDRIWDCGNISFVYDFNKLLV